MEVFPRFLRLSRRLLDNAGGTLSLTVADAGIDAAVFGPATSGVSLQLDPTRLDAATNDDPTGFCAATTSYTGIDGGDLGTPGAANTPCGVVAMGNQCVDGTTSLVRDLVSPLAGDVIITEIMADPSAVSDTVGEWIEVHAVNSVDLNGVVLTVGTNAHAFTSTSCLHLAAGTFAVLAKSAEGSVNGGLPTPVATFTQSLGNSGGTLSLTFGGAVIDGAAYDAAIAGVAWQLDPTKLDATSNDDPAHFCRATVHFAADGGGDLGTPAAMNTACPATPDAGQCMDAATSAIRAVVKPAVGDLVISEFMAAPAAVPDADGEYIEVRSNASVDLNGLVLGFDGSTSVVNSLTCLPVIAGTYSVFGSNADSQVNGGLPPLAGTFSFSLRNYGTHTISISTDAGLLDVLTYSADAGHPVAGASTQLSAQYTRPADNDVASHLCSTSAASRYGPGAVSGTGDRGTPGLPNELCP